VILLIKDDLWTKRRFYYLWTLSL